MGRGCRRRDVWSRWNRRSCLSCGDGRRPGLNSRRRVSRNRHWSDGRVDNGSQRHRIRDRGVKRRRGDDQTAGQLSRRGDPSDNEQQQRKQHDERSVGRKRCWGLEHLHQLTHKTPQRICQRRNISRCGLRGVDTPTAALWGRSSLGRGNDRSAAEPHERAHSGLACWSPRFPPSADSGAWSRAQRSDSPEP